MESVPCNINSSMLMGTICSDLREYSDSSKNKIIEFDLEMETYTPRRTIVHITCVSIGVQAELIEKSMDKGQKITILGFIGDVDIGVGPAKYGQNKFRITAVRFQSGSMVNFSGSILTQPSEVETRDGRDRIEFFLGTSRRHETMPLCSCKIKIICEGGSYKIMKAFQDKKNVLDSIFVIGYLSVENGSFCVIAKKVDLLLPQSVKNAVFREGRESENSNSDKVDTAGRGKAGGHHIRETGADEAGQGESKGDGENKSPEPVRANADDGEG